MRSLKVLTIAGSDSGGGAGIQADLKTFAALRAYGTSAITALTAQNTLGVKSIYPVSAQHVGEQIDAVLSDIGADAIKTGMLFNAEVIYTVAKKIKEYGIQLLVVDPVMVATSGDVLLQQEAIAALKSELFPLATVITPNLPEATVLLSQPLHTPMDMAMHISQLVQWGSQSVLLKGGHLDSDDMVDVLYVPSLFEVQNFQHARIETTNVHGTGCTLSAAIAVFLAQGLAIPHAVEEAIEYLHQAILASKHQRYGKGKGPVAHFWSQDENFS